MNVIIKEILALPGVVGTCVIDTDQTVQLANLPASFTATMATEVAGNAKRMMQMAGVKGLTPQTIAIHYDKFAILALAMEDTSLLLILCKPGCNTPLVITTAKMLGPELEKALKQEGAGHGQVATPETATTGQTQVDAKTAKALDFIKQSLFETIGPIAEMIYDECLGRWTEKNAADISRIFELVGCISTEMDDPHLFQEFKSKIAALL